METIADFLHKLSGPDYSNLDRAIAVIWWHSRADPTQAMDCPQIAETIHKVGYAKQNATRLRDGLSRDRRLAKADGKKFRIRIGSRESLNEQFGKFVRMKTVKVTDSVIPVDLVEGTRGYLEKVVHQINASYDCGLFDCTAVMARRLLETLIIEAYEANGKASVLKSNDGTFMMFSGLLNVIENDKSFSISRNGLAGLKAFKKLGDLSAHNRRFNACEDDIQRVRDDLRVASEELLHLANLA